MGAYLISAFAKISQNATFAAETLTGVAVLLALNCELLVLLICLLRYNHLHCTPVTITSAFATFQRKCQQWLAKFLSTYTGTLVTVSHDEALLEGVKLSAVAEVANSRVEVFKGCNYKKFLFEREERIK